MIGGQTGMAQSSSSSSSNVINSISLELPVAQQEAAVDQILQVSQAEELSNAQHSFNQNMRGNSFAASSIDDINNIDNTNSKSLKNNNTSSICHHNKRRSQVSSGCFV
jgi:hypothetical protein